MNSSISVIRLYFWNPCDRSPRRLARQARQSWLWPGHHYRNAAARGRRSNAPARDTANYVKHAEQRAAACL